MPLSILHLSLVCRLHSGTQTEDGQMPLPWEHLFPASLPLPLQQPQQLEELHPEQEYKQLHIHSQNSLKCYNFLININMSEC